MDGTASGSVTPTGYDWHFKRGGATGVYAKFDEVNQRNGKACMMVYFPAGNYFEIRSNNAYTYSLYDVNKQFEIIPGHTYRASGYMKTTDVSGDSSSGIGMKILLSTAVGGASEAITLASYIKVNQDWTYYEVEFTASGTSVAGHIELRGYGHTGAGTLTGKAYFDDINLIDTTYCNNWTKGASVANYGASGDGGVYITADDTNAPYLSIFDHAGSPWDTINTRLRLGNLNGYLGYTSDLYGIAIGEATKYLKYDTTNGLRVAGDITATSGKFGTTTNYWSVGATGLTAVSASTDVIINYGKTDFGQDSTNGFILGYDYSASVSKFEIGSSATKLFKYDGTDLSIAGGTITGGTITLASGGTNYFIGSDTGGITAFRTSGMTSWFQATTTGPMTLSGIGTSSFSTYISLTSVRDEKVAYFHRNKAVAGNTIMTVSGGSAENKISGSLVKFISTGTTTYPFLFENSGTNGSCLRLEVSDTSNTSPVLDLDFGHVGRGMVINNTYASNSADMIRIDNSGTGNSIIAPGGFELAKSGKMAIGDNVLTNEADISLMKDGVLGMKETTTPTADTNRGKVYCKSNNKLYFQDGGGTEHEIAFV